MAQGNGFMEKLAGMPKGKKLALLGVVAIPVLAVMVYFGLGLNAKKGPEENPTISIDMPDAEMDEFNKSRMKAYKDSDTGLGAKSYWDSLADDDSESQGGSDDGHIGPRKWRAEDLDPNIYSRIEIADILTGRRTKEEIDREHALRADAGQRNNDGRTSIYETSSAPMTQAQKDSAYFARMEKAYQMAAKYTAQYTTTEEPSKPETPGAPAQPEEPEERKIDLTEDATLPTDSFSGDGIISSLVDSGEDVVNYVGTTKSKPVKATFLKNEKITSGQRVIIRLMQDMVLSDGTIIPANTHITGTCDIEKRLKIDVKMLHYNGRMFPTDISVYDNDGTEGIYCPAAESSNKKKNAVTRAASDVVSGVGSVAGTILTGNPFVGRMASSGFSAATSAINDAGMIEVTVSSGYEFYVFENKERR